MPTGLTTVQLLVVAGGGGGGVNGGGGGGGGGMREQAAFEVTPGATVSITVGAGGNGERYTDDYGVIDFNQALRRVDATNGGDSAFGTFISLGGGRGAGRSAAGSGGSGGGASTWSTPTTGGAGTAGQGFAGIGPTNAPLRYGGGGGGAGAAATNNVGGDGRASSIIGSATYYGGGGGFGMFGDSGSQSAAGGIGGGGHGGTPATAGADGFGGGGGGGGQWDPPSGPSNGSNGARGGSGVVVVRYARLLADPPSPVELGFAPGRGSLLATWGASVEYGRPVVEYETELEGVATTCLFTVRVGWSRECSFEIPAYDAPYRARTRARTVGGWSAWSTWSSPFTPLDVPRWSGRGKDAEPGDGRITFAWDAFVERGRPVSRFDVTVQPGGRTCSWVAGDGPLTCIVSGLTNGVEYTADVAATNAVGTSARAPAGRATPFGLPRPPTRIALYWGWLDDSGVYAAWSGTDPNGRVVTRYEGRLEPGGATCASTGQSCHVPIITFGEGVQYRMRVRVQNDAGWSDWSAPGPPPAPPPPPAQPRFIDVIPGAGRLHLSWTSPDARGRPLVDYEACVYPVQAIRGSVDSWQDRCIVGYGAKTCTVAASATVLGCTITGLWNGANYRSIVRARNALGWGMPRFSGTADSGASEFAMPTVSPRYNATPTGRAKVRVSCTAKVVCGVRVRLTFPVAPYEAVGEWGDIEPLSTVDLQVDLPADIRRRLAEGDDFIVRVSVEQRGGASTWPQVLPLTAPPADQVGPVTLVNRTPTREFTAVADCDGDGISRCSGTVVLVPQSGVRAGRVLGRASFSAAAGERMTIRVRLGGAARRLLTRSGTLVVRPIFVMHGGTMAPRAPVVRFYALAPTTFLARAERIDVLAARSMLLRVVRSASQQRRAWPDAASLLERAVLPSQHEALREAIGLKGSTAPLRRARFLLVRASRAQIAATRGYVAWLRADEVAGLRAATAADRRARWDRREALRVARAERAALG
ncbi:MAG: glycine-rich domain-containing protein [Gaiellales bacterium]